MTISVSHSDCSLIAGISRGESGREQVQDEGDTETARVPPVWPAQL